MGHIKIVYGGKIIAIKNTLPYKMVILFDKIHLIKIFNAVPMLVDGDILTFKGPKLIIKFLEVFNRLYNKRRTRI